MRPVAIIALGEEAERQALVTAHELRLEGRSVELGYRGNLRRRMQRADRIGASHAIIIGERELARGVAVVRDLDSGEQRELSLENVGEGLPQQDA